MYLGGLFQICLRFCSPYYETKKLSIEATLLPPNEKYDASFSSLKKTLTTAQGWLYHKVKIGTNLT